jgi:Polysaccharide pyruvyl transferase
MKKISVFDTTISNYNLGNWIIMDAVYLHLYEMFSNDFFFKIPNIEITKHTLNYLSTSDRIFFGGTNALSSKMESYKQLGFNLLNCHKIKDVTLMGVGWWQYQNIKTSRYTKYILSKTLSPQYFHSVRDNYTKNKLNDIGFKNVINTGCPTLWNFTKQHCVSIPKYKTDNVILTLTDYNQDFVRDKRLIEILLKNYSKIYFWVQGKGDYDYIKTLVAENFYEIIPPYLDAFDDFLKNNTVDYIGTRLHAGIRALQYKRRSLILSVDNRAAEMAKDFNLPVIQRDNIETIEHQFILSEYTTDINIPFQDIYKWKNQFV